MKDITGEGEGAIDWRSAYIALHSQVSGYLHGEDLEHWQRYNAEKFPLTKPEPKAGVVTEEMVGEALAAWLSFGGMPANGGNSGAAMRAALEAGGVGSGWVKCSERYPESGASVYISRRGVVCAAVRRSDAFVNLEGGHVYYDHNKDDVTYWMPRPLPRPLPDGPEGK